MNRRKFISAATSALGALGFHVTGNAMPVLAAGKREVGAGNKSMPNVLILMTDQHRRTCMGAAGDPVAITPNLDKLARESVYFTNAPRWSP